ncbi:MAG: branched-chain amino acid ABC transporter permease [Eubacteriales bacterium]|nr:branched-chain amino acid ABC transporter permease [Clostridiales bacterium]MDD6915280.1 branched-chain amino acid ABC transporter permease [Eubacteriales bacterium]MDY5230061.1 branched-chain amino acid ABC transporter permease [Eubacteriales bacterium]
MSKLKSLNKFTVTNIKCYGMVIIAFAILYPMLQADMISNKISGLLIPICAYVVMAISLNLTVGFLGELSLGHAGFMSVGAFSGVITVACMQDGMPAPVKLLIAIIIGGIMAGILGLIIGIPVIRLKGDYLAIVTLAFGEIIKNIINCVYVGLDGSGLHFSMKSAEALGMDAGKMILNGPQGAVSISKISTFTAGILLILFSLFVVLNLVNSKTGRAVTAIRDNRIAAESVGINITKYKLTAFIISAIIAGMAGALYAMNFSTIAARKFDFNTSILILVFVVLGGMGNIPGTIIATTLLYMLPELLRQFSDYRMLIYAIVLIVVMLATNSPRMKMYKDKITAVFKRNKNMDREGDVSNG